MTILDPCMSLEWIKKIGCVGSCGYAPDSIKSLGTSKFIDKSFVLGWRILVDRDF